MREEEKDIAGGKDVEYNRRQGGRIQQKAKTLDVSGGKEVGCSRRQRVEM